MPTTLPQSVREHMGDQVADDFARWLEAYVGERAVARSEYREVLSRLDVLEERFDHVEQRFDQIDQRFERVEERLDQIDQRIDEQGARIDQRIDEHGARIDDRLDRMVAQFDQRFDAMSATFDQRLDGVHERIDRLHEQMRVQMRWTVGTIALFGTIVTVLLAIAEFGG